MIYYFLLYCRGCKNSQRIWSQSEKPKGSRLCVHCNRSITLNRENMKRIK